MSEIIDDQTRQRYDAAGFGRPVGIGKRPALLIIDVQYRTTGTTPQPFDEAINEFTTSCGDVAWQAVANIERLLTFFRAQGWPVLYPYVAPKKAFDAGALGAKVPGIMDVPDKGYEFHPAIAPLDGEILLPKRHPSAFFGTPLLSYLIQAGVDSLVVTGCSTSGCVRGSAVDAFSYNYKVAVPNDAVYDRSPLVHEVNLFDMGQKYADVQTTSELIASLEGVAAG
jgi:maleamate amidohydrolase